MLFKIHANHFSAESMQLLQIVGQFIYILEEDYLITIYSLLGWSKVSSRKQAPLPYDHFKAIINFELSPARELITSLFLVWVWLMHQKHQAKHQEGQKVLQSPLERKKTQFAYTHYMYTGQYLCYQFYLHFHVKMLSLQLLVDSLIPC